MRPLFLTILLFTACDPNTDTSTDGDTDTDTGSDTDTDTDTGQPQTQEEDLAQYDALAVSLEEYRTPFLGDNADEITAYGSKLFWLDFHSTFNPTLYVWTGSGTTGTAIVELAGDSYNFRASESIALTAIPEGDQVRYSSYTFDGTHQGDLVVAAPTTGARWWAYAADATTAYLVEPDNADGTLQSWPASGNSTTVVTTFSSMGATLGEFWDFDVEGQTMIFVESGRIWRANLATNSATWLGNSTQVTGKMAYGADDVVYGTASGMLHFDYETGAARDINAEIEASSYQLNNTYATMHHPTGDGFARVGDKVVYKGNSAVFAYDLTTGEIEPILLEPRRVPSVENPRIVYKDPAMLTDGTLFITGLESASGSVGADGPVWRVDHPFLK